MTIPEKPVLPAPEGPPDPAPSTPEKMAVYVEQAIETVKGLDRQIRHYCLLVLANVRDGLRAALSERTAPSPRPPEPEGRGMASWKKDGPEWAAWPWSQAVALVTAGDVPGAIRWFKKTMEDLFEAADASASAIYKLSQSLGCKHADRCQMEHDPLACAQERIAALGVLLSDALRELGGIGGATVFSCTGEQAAVLERMRVFLTREGVGPSPHDQETPTASPEGPPDPAPAAASAGLREALMGWVRLHEEDGCCGPGTAAERAKQFGDEDSEDYCDLCVASRIALAVVAPLPEKQSEARAASAGEGALRRCWDVYAHPDEGFLQRVCRLPDGHHLHSDGEKSWRDDP